MKNYEVTDVLELGNAGSMIRDKEIETADEFVNPLGPQGEYLDAE